MFIMDLNKKKVRALGLSSGGLDSILSGLVLKNIGIEVTWISFETPFFSSEKAKKASGKTKIPLIIKDITEIYMEMLENPPCGYGRHMNPCLDCHALMFRLAGRVMEEKGFDFLFSGEVVGQRPMSQTRPSLRYVEKNSGYEGYIVRPLSIKLLAPTIPEKKGLIDRQSLYGFSGRSRKAQIALAKEFKIDDYPAPAGGCLLTDKGFSVRLKDLFKYEKKILKKDLRLLKYGRHFRIDPLSKIIVGRNKKDNQAILRHYDNENHILIKTVNIPGPVVIVPAKASDKALRVACSLCVGYAKADGINPVEILIKTPLGEKRKKEKGIAPSMVKNFII